MTENGAANIEATYRTDVEEHLVTVDGAEVATAHKVAGGMWSVKVDGKFFAIAADEATAIKTLEKYAATLRPVLVP